MREDPLGAGREQRPITSTTNVRFQATADCLTRSTAQTIAFSAVSEPIASSEPGRELSIPAGTQTIGTRKAGCAPRASCIR